MSRGRPESQQHCYYTHSPEALLIELSQPGRRLSRQQLNTATNRDEAERSSDSQDGLQVASDPFENRWSSERRRRASVRRIR